MAANYRLVFTHIGKTGGSSVAAFLDLSTPAISTC
jgi:hypothetical protein